MSGSNMINKHKPLSKVGVYALFIIFTLCTVYPMIWLGYSSLKTNSEITNDALALPAEPQFSNFTQAWTIGKIDRGYKNSTIYLIFTLSIVLMSSMMCSYAFAKSPFKKTSKILQIVIGMGILLSTHSVMIPLFMMLKEMGLTGKNARLGIILTYSAVSVPLSVFIATEYVRGLPDSLVESASIDGAGRFKIFWSIILPMCKPIMVTTGILTSLATWNEFLLGFILSNRETRALPPTIIAFANPMTPNYHLQMAGLVIAVIPMIILYSIFNRHITKGVVGGAIKG